MKNMQAIKDAIWQQILPVKKGNADNRVLFLDFLKAAAAFFVVFYHFSFSRLDYGFVEGNLYVPNINRIGMCFAACSVPLFFLVNGVLMFHRKRDWKSVYWKAAKILVLTVIWSVAGFPSWFFKTLAILYVLFPFFQYVKEHSRPVYFGICGCVFLMPFVYNLTILILHFAGVHNIGPIQVDSLRVTGCFTMYSILYFLLGPILAEKKKYPLWAGIPLILFGWALVTFECAVYINMNQKMYDSVNSAFPTVGALCLAVGLYMLFSRFTFRSVKKALLFIADGILPIYLIHMWIISLIPQIGVFQNLNLATAALGTALICFVCILLGKVIQRIPVLCWLLKM